MGIFREECGVSALGLPSNPTCQTGSCWWKPNLTSIDSHMHYVMKSKLERVDRTSGDFPGPLASSANFLLPDFLLAKPPDPHSIRLGLCGKSESCSSSKSLLSIPHLVREPRQTTFPRTSCSKASCDSSWPVKL